MRVSKVKVFSGDKERLERRIEARQKTIENAEMRAGEYRSALEIRINETRPETKSGSANSSAPVPDRKQEIESLANQLREAKKGRRSQTKTGPWWTPNVELFCIVWFNWEKISLVDFRLGHLRRSKAQFYLLVLYPNPCIFSRSYYKLDDENTERVRRGLFFCCL